VALFPAAAIASDQATEEAYVVPSPWWFHGEWGAGAALSTYRSGPTSHGSFGFTVERPTPDASSWITPLLHVRLSGFLPIPAGLLELGGGGALASEEARIEVSVSWLAGGISLFGPVYGPAFEVVILGGSGGRALMGVGFRLIPLVRPPKTFSEAPDGYVITGAFVLRRHLPPAYRQPSPWWYEPDEEELRP